MFLTINLKKRRRLLAFAVLLTCAALLLWLAWRLYPLAHVGLIADSAERYGLKPSFVCAVINAESRFKPDAFSHKGAGGLMQITEPTAKWLAAEMGAENFEYSAVFQPEVNIPMGCYYLSRLLEKYGGDQTLALAAYNAGEGNVAKWLKNPEYSADGETLDVIPFRETRKYIDRVRLNTIVYGKLLPLFGGNDD